MYNQTKQKESFGLQRETDARRHATLKEVQDADPISSVIIAAMKQIAKHKYVPRKTMGDKV